MRSCVTLTQPDAGISGRTSTVTLLTVLPGARPSPPTVLSVVRLIQSCLQNAVPIPQRGAEGLLSLDLCRLLPPCPVGATRAWSHWTAAHPLTPAFFSRSLPVHP